MSFYDEIEIEDMTFDKKLQLYHYPCPCGDRFEISLGDLRDGEEVAVCPSCSLMIKVVFEAVSAKVSEPAGILRADGAAERPAKGRATTCSAGTQSTSCHCCLNNK